MSYLNVCLHAQRSWFPSYCLDLNGHCFGHCLQSSRKKGKSVTPVDRRNTSFRAQTCHAAGLFGPYSLCGSLAESQILEQQAGTSLPCMLTLCSLALIWCNSCGRNEAAIANAQSEIQAADLAGDVAAAGWRCGTSHTIKMQLLQPLLFTLITCLSS